MTKYRNTSIFFHFEPSLPDHVGSHFGLSVPGEESFPISGYSRGFLGRVEIREIPDHFPDEKVPAEMIESRPIRGQSRRLIVFGEHYSRKLVESFYGAGAEFWGRGRRKWRRKRKEMGEGNG